MPEFEKLKYLEFRVDIENIFPPIYRQFEIPETSTFYDLHQAIQACGWLDCHLWGFLNNKNQEIAGVPNDDYDLDCPDATTILVKDYFKRKGSTCRYLYDFGDGWEHKVKLVGRTKHDGDAKMILVDGARSFPPEDCGGYGGYERVSTFAKTGVDPWGEEESLGEWLGDWHPEAFDISEFANTVVADDNNLLAQEFGLAPGQTSRFRHTTDGLEVFDQALSRLDADDFRQLCRDLIVNPKFDLAGYDLLRDTVVFCGRKKCPDWELPPVLDSEQEAVVEFFKKVEKGARFQPQEVDEILRFASATLLRDNDGLALHILSGLLPAMINDVLQVEGNYECLSEVLTYDLARATTELALAAFASVPVHRRPELIFAVFGCSSYLYVGFQPLRAMTSFSIHPLPQWEEFLPLWLAYLEDQSREKNHPSTLVMIPPWIKEVKSLLLHDG